MNRRTVAWVSVGVEGAGFVAYVVYPYLCRRSAGADAEVPLPGDTIVDSPRNGYTLAVDIAAPPEEVWPWLVQMGQGRAGFYTHTWVENLLRAEFKNAETIVPDLQHLAVGDRMRLTPDPYLGKPGQYMVVSEISPGEALVLQQPLPNGSVGTLAYVLKPEDAGGTRLVFRRRGAKPSLFDQVMLPGYVFMDRGMLNGIRRRAEGRRSSTVPGLGSK